MLIMFTYILLNDNIFSYPFLDFVNDYARF